MVDAGAGEQQAAGYCLRKDSGLNRKSTEIVSVLFSLPESGAQLLSTPQYFHGIFFEDTVSS